MKRNIKKRVFVVGCPRSGTTLLQSLLAAHPSIASFPESHFLPKIVARGSKRRQRFGIVAPQAKENYTQVLNDVGAKDCEHNKPRFGLFVREYILSFVETLDDLTEAQNRTVWLEKTPRHLHYINNLEKAVPDIAFIHIIRKGSDVVASLFEVTHKYPEVWGGPRDVERCISRWIQDVELSRQYLGKPNHTFVSYEKLVERPKLNVKQLCDFLNVPYLESMLEDYKNVSKKVLSPGEQWKESVQQPIYAAKSRKFDHLFSPEQQNYISTRVEQVGEFL